jgi:hypothetical protein
MGDSVKIEAIFLFDLYIKHNDEMKNSPNYTVLVSEND